MRTSVAMLLIGTLGFAPLPVAAEPIAFKMLPNYSRATFKTDAPLETIVGTTAGPGVSGEVIVDLAKPQTATGVIRVDLTTVNSGVAKRDADMKGPDYLDTANEANRYAVDVLRVRAKFQTTFTNHGMQIPQLLVLKVANEIQLETDLTLVRK